MIKMQESQLNIFMLECFMLLGVKHTFADLWLQFFLGKQNKTSYFGNAHLHYAHHGVGTLLVMFWFVPWHLAIACALFDYILHWHIDWAKTNYQNFMNITRNSNAGHFWFVQSVDQSLHFATYYIIVKFLG